MKLLLAALMLISSIRAIALDADDLEQAVGYFILASSTVTASGENDDGDTFVKVRGHGEFVFEGAQLAPLELSTVIILAKQVKLGDKTVVLYKLVIDDEISDVRKTR